MLGQSFFLIFSDLRKCYSCDIFDILHKLNIKLEARAALRCGSGYPKIMHWFKLLYLLGKQPNGPGQYIFGAVAPTSGKTIFTGN
jgi:hypothetical protein